MKKEKQVQLIPVMIIFVFTAIFLVSSVSALTANSSSYSVNIFGTGMATGTASSANYENATFLSESEGRTRNAESSSLTANIGFFEDTPYYRTVSITSYSISPSSAVVGSTISLYISALNYESIRAKITAPNSQQQTVNLVNNEFVTYSPPSIVGIYTVTFYANSSTGAIASVVDYFELTEQPSTPPAQLPSGRGGTTTIIEKCTYNWDCTPWSVCSDGKMTRECVNVGTCEGDEGKPREEMECPKALFDISLKLKNIKLREDGIVGFVVEFIEKMTTEKIDVHIKYSIINKENEEIFSQIETKAIQQNLVYEKEIDEIKLIDDVYILRVDILYGNLQRAFAEQRFLIKGSEIHLEKQTTSQRIIEFLKNYKIVLIIITLIIILIPFRKLLFLFRRDRYGRDNIYQSRIKQHLRKIGGKHIILILMSFALIGILFFAGPGITGFIAKNLTFKKEASNAVWFILITGIIGALIFLYKNKIRVSIGKIKEQFRKKYLINSIKGLRNKKVYSESGDSIGKISEIILGNNRIDSLKIKLNRKNKFKKKGVIIKWRDIVCCGEIVIVNKSILDGLEKAHKKI